MVLHMYNLQNINSCQMSDNKYPLVSIIIPVYNVETYIERCLMSVVEQTYANIEIILIDDCGSDNSIALANKILAQSSRHFRVVDQKYNQGVSVARNTGLKEANGDYVYFMDSDDEITPDCIEKLVKPLSTYQYDMVIGSYDTIGDRESHMPSGQGVSLMNSSSVIEYYGKGGWHVMPWNKLCRKQFLCDNHLTFLEGQALHEDFIWSFQTACTAASAFVVNSPTYKYRINPRSVMKTASIESDLVAYIPAFNQMISFVKKTGLTHSGPIYQMIEGKKNGILYSLLQKKERSMYKQYYKSFHNNHYVSPLKAYQDGIIGIASLMRDLDNIMNPTLGRWYKRFFYFIVYSAWNRKINGALWE